MAIPCFQTCPPGNGVKYPANGARKMQKVNLRTVLLYSTGRWKRLNLNYAPPATNKTIPTLCPELLRRGQSALAFGEQVFLKFLDSKLRL